MASTLDLERIDLIIHPVRLRILQTLLGEELTTQEISERLPEIPTSSIYRHLRLLLEAGMITVAEAKLVHGIREKVYRLEQAPRLTEEHTENLTAEGHFRYFTIYALTLLRDFADYLRRAQEEGGTVDAAADFAGYTEARFYATDEELQRFQEALNQALLPLLENQPGERRKRHKVAVVAQPVPGKRAEDGDQEGNDE